MLEIKQWTGGSLKHRSQHTGYVPENQQCYLGAINSISLRKVILWVISYLLLGKFNWSFDFWWRITWKPKEVHIFLSEHRIIYLLQYCVYTVFIYRNTHQMIGKITLEIIFKNKLFCLYEIRGENHKYLQLCLNS